MSLAGIERARCYLVLQGLECSLSETIVTCLDTSLQQFLTKDESYWGLERLRQDIGEDWQLSDVTNVDLLPYLDLGHLVHLLNRHVPNSRTIPASEISFATQIIEKENIIGIRKRVMHPVRPLEAQDLTTLQGVAKALLAKAPSLKWDALKDGLLSSENQSTIFGVQIPPYWAEDSSVFHNLPPADFADTGFIGRTAERAQLKSLLGTDQRVITIVGQAGKGKTALALRVCNDMLDESPRLFDRIVWTTLKTQFLTPEGIKDINNAVDTVHKLIRVILENVAQTAADESSGAWGRVIEQMNASRLLLVIDNLETVGEQIRDLVLNIPQGSKVLLTSRVGLGEIEQRMELPEFSAKDASALFRRVANVYNYQSLKGLSENSVKDYCNRLHFNPLLIRWFVQAVGRGADPGALLVSPKLEEALEFCFSSVYGGFSELGKSLLSILLAAKAYLSYAQLQELSGADYVTFTVAIQELLRANYTTRYFDENGVAIFRLEGLVYEYIAKKYPPGDKLVLEIRHKLQSWVNIQEYSTVAEATYRYTKGLLHIQTIDQRVAALHLLRVLKAAKANDLSTAMSALETAIQLTPTWWEVYRVQAQVFEQIGRPIYDIERAYELSLECEDNDVTRYHYATYLLGIDENQRVIDQVNAGLKLTATIPQSFKGLKGLALMRLGQYPDAINLLEEVWTSRTDTLPKNVLRSQGTQLISAFRRRAERYRSLGNRTGAIQDLCSATDRATAVLELCGADSRFAQEALHAMVDALKLLKAADFSKHEFASICKLWDSRQDFVASAAQSDRAHLHLSSVTDDAERFFPNISLALKTSKGSLQVSDMLNGIVRVRFEHFGFVTTDTLEDVHFTRDSLVHKQEWEELIAGRPVDLNTVNQKRGLHAVQLKVSRE